MYGPTALSAQLTKANHASIAFNSKRHQYLVVYNDSRNGNADVFGIILDEAGNIVKADFAVNASKGEQINAYACYNSTDDTFLINWEDFRYVSAWQEPGNIYGALLNGDGTSIKNDIAICDDHEAPDAEISGCRILPIILTEMSFLPPGGIHGPHLMVRVLWDGLSCRTERRLDRTLL